MDVEDRKGSEDESLVNVFNRINQDLELLDDRSKRHRASIEAAKEREDESDKKITWLMERVTAFEGRLNEQAETITGLLNKVRSFLDSSLELVTKTTIF